MSSDANKFQWKDSIEITEKDPVLMAKLSDLLDCLAQIPEGRDLIRKAKEVSGGIVQLAASPDSFTLKGKPLASDSPLRDKNKNTASFEKTGHHKYEGKIVIDPVKASFQWSTPKGDDFIASPMSLLVHELFHLADPNQLPHVREERKKLAIREELEHIIDIKGAHPDARNKIIERAAVIVLENKQHDRELYRHLRDHSLSEEDLKLLQPAAGQFFKLSPRIPGHPLPPDKGFQPLRGSVVGGEPEVPYVRQEEQAVDYTDRFMMKYFEGQQPRRYYGNGRMVKEDIPAQSIPKLRPAPKPDNELLPYLPWELHPSLGNLPKPLSFSTPSPENIEEALVNAAARTNNTKTPLELAIAFSNEGRDPVYKKVIESLIDKGARVTDEMLQSARNFSPEPHWRTHDAATMSASPSQAPSEVYRMLVKAKRQQDMAGQKPLAPEPTVPLSPQNTTGGAGNNAASTDVSARMIAAASPPTGAMNAQKEAMKPQTYHGVMPQQVQVAANLPTKTGVATGHSIV